jgi:Cytochrome c oxidase subunit VII
MFERPNTVLEQQKIIQKGSTPYLRGDADPTYLRLPADKLIAVGMLSATALGWAMILYKHTKMWNGQKS